jgi:hypothetical protein
VDDDDAVFRRGREQDVVAGSDIVLPPRSGRDDDAGLVRYAEQAVGGGEDDDPA